MTFEAVLRLCIHVYKYALVYMQTCTYTELARNRDFETMHIEMIVWKHENG